MNTAKDICDHFISRAKALHEYTVTVDVPEGFKFNGLVPFDMQIKEGVINATVYAVSFEEAVQRLDEFLQNCV
jgi:hypothetical protein